MLPSVRRLARVGPGSRLLAARSVSSKPVSVGELPPFEYKPPPYEGPSKEEVIALRKEYLNPGESSLRARGGGQVLISSKTWLYTVIFTDYH